MKILKKIIILIFGLSCLSSCSEDTVNKQRDPFKFDLDRFKSYWHQGKAELSRYSLEQARYGELHKGDVVLVFVTENFSKGKQVKLDSPNKDDSMPILKFNYVKKFVTGIYDYSMMSSVFTPVDFKKHPFSIKLTTTSQEWCGHTFTQFNLRDDKYSIKQYSYFESEGDKDKSISAVILEDDLWAKIRLSPAALPIGKVKIVPGTMYTRLLHKKIEPVEAEAILYDYKDSDFASGDLKVYSIDYKSLDRNLSIIFKPQFPFEIVGWKESYVSGWGKSAKKLTSTAKLTHSILLDYWNKNNKGDLKLRNTLGFSPNALSVKKEKEKPDVKNESKK